MFSRDWDLLGTFGPSQDPIPAASWISSGESRFFWPLLVYFDSNRAFESLRYFWQD